MQKIKKGDQVIVLRGRYRGKRGKVLLVRRDSVIVEKINVIKRHTKPSPKNQSGGIIEKEAPLHISKVALLDPKTSQPTRVGFKMREGVWVRVAKRSGELLKS